MKPEVKTTGVSKSPVRIGINMEGEKSLNGMKLDRLQIQNVALSEDEVKALYNLKFP